MKAPAPVRRFICPDCKHVHLAWAARCLSCHSLSGLKLASEAEVAAADLPPQLPDEPPEVEAPEPSRPRLMIARAPSPQPELDAPAEELADVLGPSAPMPVPITEIMETSFVRDSTGLVPVDHVLGGGLVAASVVLLASPPGIGKCLGRGTPVLLFDGRVLPVEQISLGDHLMGPDGRPRVVLSKSQGFGDLYRIDPVKGEPWVCNDSHVLTLVHSCTDEVFDLPLDEWLNKAPNSDVRHYGKLFSVGVEAFGGAQPELPIDPYFLGAWFGDGTKALVERTTGEQLATVQITKPDPEIRALCEEQAKLWGLRMQAYDAETKCVSYRLVANEAPVGEGRWEPNPLLRALRDIVGQGVDVPAAYLRASREARLQFLAGWCDTDGELANATFVITQKREDWARAVWWLARSLGFCATLKPRLAHYTRTDNLTFEGTYWVVTISGDTDQIPTRLPRKKAPPRRQKKIVTRTGFSVHALGEGAYYGFTVDGDGRFLLGDFTVTHNSSLTLQVLVGLRHRCLYVTGEETIEQLAGTARRIGALSPRLHVLAERDLATVFAHARAMRAQTIAIDSIQKMLCEDVNGRAGSPGQIKECTARLVDYAKNNDTGMWIIGHVTGDGDIAGPKTLEHDVDVVLELSPGGGADDPWAMLKKLSSEQPDLTIAEALRMAEALSADTGVGNERILRCPSKNRFGPTNVTGRFHLTAKGFVPIDADGWNEEL